ncbi:MAG: ABC transporter ATP-binding protein [Anaerolineae bacterium]|jgi:simple sugar transport system ATP-binding protein
MNDVVSMSGITKRFPAVVANDGIDFSVRGGEIHALLGENGAGKTTLMNILYGLYRPDSGEVFLRGEPVAIDSPLDAIRLGITMVHQHFMLVDTLTVTDNVVLGREPARLGVLDTRSAVARVQEISSTYGLPVDATARAEDLSVCEKQRVEIVKALFRGAELLILDEPTAVLTPQEVEELFRVMRFLRENGKTIIFITHKLNETMEISDRVTVLRKGKVVGTVERSETSPKELANMMVGRDVVLRVNKEEDGARRGEVLRLDGVHAKNLRGTERLKGLDLSLARGEILGIAGVEGNGQRALAEVIIGLSKPSKGRILLDGRETAGKGVAARMALGLAHVPEDRQSQGLILEFTLEENLVLGVHTRPPFSRASVLRRSVLSTYSADLIGRYRIEPADGKTRAGQLSGGNQQRVILARELGVEGLRILLAAQPTRGLDVGAVEFVYKTLLDLRGAGMAVLLISADLDELRALSDRIAVIYEGRIVEVRPTAAYTQEELGLLMGGAECRRP